MIGCWVETLKGADPDLKLYFVALGARSVSGASKRIEIEKNVHEKKKSVDTRARVKLENLFERIYTGLDLEIYLMDDFLELTILLCMMDISGMENIQHDSCLGGLGNVTIDEAM